MILTFWKCKSRLFKVENTVSDNVQYPVSSLALGKCMASACCTLTVLFGSFSIRHGHF